MLVNREQKSPYFGAAYIICILAALFYVYDYFIQVAPSVMTHQLRHSFHIDATGLGILSACFYYAYAGMQLPAGILLDRYGPRRLLTVMVFISGSGVILFGMTDHFVLAAFSRILIGLGSAFAFLSALFLVSRWFTHKHFAMFAGFIQAAACLGAIIGLAPLAILVNHHGWRDVMIGTGLATYGLVIIYALFIRDGKPPKEQKRRKKGAHDTWHRLRILVARPQVWWVAACSGVSWVPAAAIGALWGVPYLMRVYHLTNTQAGAWMTILWVAIAIGSPLMGWFAVRIRSRKKPLYICYSAGLIGSILFLEAQHLPLIVTGFSLLLLGFSASSQAMTFGCMKDIVPANTFGTASGIINMACLVGGAISQPLIGVLLDWQWDGLRNAHGVMIYSAQNYRAAFFILPVAAVIGLYVSIRHLKETHCKMRHEL